MTVTRAARLTGAALSAALALITAGWLLRDLSALGGSPAELAWYWAGDHRTLRGRSATSGFDLILTGVYIATAVAALRSPVAASALAATGALTLALRLPGLWATAAGSDALLTTLFHLALAAALLVVAAVGRRPANAAYEAVPTRPRTGPAVTAAVLLLIAGLVETAWEIYWALELPAEFTVDRFTGGRSVLAPMLAPPPGWLAAVLVLLTLTAAGSAFARPPYSRPLGLVTGAFLCGGGLMGFLMGVRYGLVENFFRGDETQQLSVLSSVFYVLAGATVLVVLAVRGERRVAPAPPGTPALAPTPPYPRPPGW
ncbi:hypothetical protein [Streptomyces sp. NPDC046712]|uniref:hypothetical protein n=1 Tax=Streptomyces sp. NPDC046712 TaxID=3154802 RepID=UPI003408A3F0